jgi:glycine dehydrogenase subunit 2
MSNLQSTHSGHRGLIHEEPLIFELDGEGRSGVDLPDIPVVRSRLGGMERHNPIGLPGLSEPQVVRHFVRLSQKNYSIDAGLYPLGSCTMKHNPRLNEKVARLPGFSDIHPLQPISTVQGALELIDTLAHWLKTLAGMPAVAMSPAAGAHGELCGLMAIRAAHKAKGTDDKKIVLVPESAHGTNPATASFCGYKVRSIPASDDGRVDMAAFESAMDDDVAALMLTNPNTVGLFERDIRKIAHKLHARGAYFYCDGANFNAIIGRVRPGDLGIDAMHINLHKTFSTPHGGGGPGSGPVVLSRALAPFAPIPYIVHTDNGYEVIEHAAKSEPTFGRMKAFHGQMGMFVRALSWAMSHGSDGLRQASENAVLNANYLRVKLSKTMSVAYDAICMHEVVFDDSFLKDTGVSTLDFAKALIDEGYHPPTMYFPLVVHGALLVEPTESETRETLDLFAHSILALVKDAKDGKVKKFSTAPIMTPRKRLDETSAARHPVLRWAKPEPETIAAE